MKSGMSIGSVVLLAALFSGCAGMGGKHDYRRSTAELGYTGKGRLVVAVQDRRSYVVSGNKSQNFVGFARGGYGNPVDAITASKAPLAADMTDALATTMQRAGFEVTKVTVPVAGGADAARKILSDSADRALFLVLNEWKTETGGTYFIGTGGGTTLLYNATMNVMKRGKVLASSTVQGSDDLGSSAWSPTGNAEKAVPVAFKKKLEQLLDDPAIAKALK